MTTNPENQEHSLEEEKIDQTVTENPDQVDEPQKSTALAQGVTRRLVTRALAISGIGLLANGISGGKLSEFLFPKVEATESESLKRDSDEIAGKFEKQLPEIVKKVEANHPNLEDKDKAIKIIDYLGVALFGWGLASLMPGGKGHIQAVQYGTLITLTAAKYSFSSPEGKKHLKDETISNAKAFGIIGGTIAVAEGINADIEKIFEAEYENEPSKYDQAALITLMSSALSPLATTVGSAGVVSKMSNRLADGDKKMMATFVSHVSNLSGFLLFGDPPFIAICEKYGFWEGIAWQMKTMWPMALYSLYTSTYKLNLALAEKEGLEGKEAANKASEETKQGLVKNLPVLRRILTKSALNFAKYFTNKEQEITGLEIKIGEVLSEKLTNLFSLPYNPKFDQPDHHHTTEIPPQPIPEDSVFQATLEEMIAEDNDPSPAEENIIKKFGKNAKKIYKNSSNVDRIKAAAGHNLGDVINVFPFQAGCVPFLTPVFEDLVKLIENVDETMKEMIIFFMLMIFSMFADNYVACKIGLTLLPNKPHIPLIASIQGGSMSAIGNMANVTQFSLKDFSLADSLKLKTLWGHADAALMGLAYSQALTLLSNAGLVNVPKPKTEKEHHASNTPEEVINSSRRAFLFGKKNA